MSCSNHKHRNVRRKPVYRFDDLGRFVRRDAGRGLVEQQHLWLERKPYRQIKQALLTVSKVRYKRFERCAIPNSSNMSPHSR